MIIIERIKLITFNKRRLYYNIIVQEVPQVNSCIYLEIILSLILGREEQVNSASLKAWKPLGFVM